MNGKRPLTLEALKGILRDQGHGLQLSSASEDSPSAEQTSTTHRRFPVAIPPNDLLEAMVKMYIVPLLCAVTFKTDSGGVHMIAHFLGCPEGGVAKKIAGESEIDYETTNYALCHERGIPLGNCCEGVLKVLLIK